MSKLYNTILERKLLWIYGNNIDLNNEIFKGIKTIKFVSEKSDADKLRGYCIGNREVLFIVMPHYHNIRFKIDEVSDFLQSLNIDIKIIRYKDEIKVLENE